MQTEYTKPTLRATTNTLARTMSAKAAAVRADEQRLKAALIEKGQLGIRMFRERYGRNPTRRELELLMARAVEASIKRTKPVHLKTRPAIRVVKWPPVRTARTRRARTSHRVGRPIPTTTNRPASTADPEDSSSEPPGKRALPREVRS